VEVLFEQSNGPKRLIRAAAMLCRCRSIEEKETFMLPTFPGIQRKVRSSPTGKGRVKKGRDEEGKRK
jgi:hypothetical protein